MSLILNENLGEPGSEFILYDDKLNEHKVLLDDKGRPIYEPIDILTDDNDKVQYPSGFTEYILKDEAGKEYIAGKKDETGRWYFKSDYPCYLYENEGQMIFDYLVYDVNTPVIEATNIKGDREVIFLAQDETPLFSEANSVPVFSGEDKEEIYPTNWDNDYRVLWDENLEPHTVKKTEGGYLADDSLPSSLKDKNGEVVEATPEAPVEPEDKRVIFLDRKGNEIKLEVDVSNKPIFENNTPIPVWRESVIYYPSDFGDAVMMWDVEDKPVKIYLDINGEYVFPKEGINYPLTDHFGNIHDPYKDAGVEEPDDDMVTYEVMCQSTVCSIQVTQHKDHIETSEDIMNDLASCRMSMLESVMLNTEV